MLLFLDTETTNLPDFNKRASDPSQPHMVQCAAIITDELGNIQTEYNVLVKPDGKWNMSKEAFAAHGITEERAKAEGVDPVEVGNKLVEMIRATSNIIIFGATFDKFIARIHLRRTHILKDEQDAWWKQLPTYCVMRAMTPICKLPPVAGSRGQYKFPKLAEAYEFAFAKKLEGAHDAAKDIAATRELYFWIKKNVK